MRLLVTVLLLCLTILFGLTMDARAQGLPCASEEPPVEVPKLMGGGTETEPGVRLRYRYDGSGRIVERHTRVLEAAPGAPTEASDRFRYDEHGHLVELSMGSGLRVLVDRNAAGHIERFRMGRGERIAREWTETRLEWATASDARHEAPDYTELVLYAWNGRLVVSYLPLVDGGRAGTVTTTRWACTATAEGRGHPSRGRPANAECARQGEGSGELTYDDEGRLVRGSLDGRFERVTVVVRYANGLPVRLEETRVSGNSATEEETRLELEDGQLSSVTFREGRTRHLERDARGRVVRLENRWRPANARFPDRVTTYRYRCR